MQTQRTDQGRRADRLLDAAAELLVTGGTRRIRIEDVAAKAGVGKGTVYLHWSGREHLLLAVGARAAATMFDEVADAVRCDPGEAAPHRYLWRLFLAAFRHPGLATIFDAGPRELVSFAGQPERSGLRETKPGAVRDYLCALSDNGLLRSDLDLADVDDGMRAVAYGFFAGTASGCYDSSDRVRYRADQLAGVIRRAFEPVEPPASGRYAAAAPAVIDAFTRLAGEFRRTAYGTAAD